VEGYGDTMNIPEINAAQVHTLHEMVNGTDAFSQIIPDAEKDSKTDFEAWTKGGEETQQLVDLGLIIEITEKCSSQLANVFLQTNRKFRIFETSEVGRLMFANTEKRSIN
jgi:hypothetical protein